MSLDPVRRETRHAIKQFSDTQQRLREIDEKIKQIEEGDGHRTPRIRASTRNHPRFRARDELCQPVHNAVSPLRSFDLVTDNLTHLPVKVDKHSVDILSGSLARHRDQPHSPQRGPNRSLGRKVSVEVTLTFQELRTGD